MKRLRTISELVASLERVLSRIEAPRPAQRRRRRAPRLQTSTKPEPLPAVAEGHLSVGPRDIDEQVVAFVEVDAPVAPEQPSPALPLGLTCGDCRNWPRCKALIQDLTAKETSCDFAPSRFAPAPVATPPPPEPPPQAYVPNSALPPGRACRDCTSFASCRTQVPAMRGDETSCEWAPARFVLAPAAPSTPAPLKVKTLRGTCGAACAITGRRCGLPASKHQEHASGRYRFTAVALPGDEYFPRAEALALAANRRNGGLCDG